MDVTDPRDDPSWAWNCYWHADRIASCMDGAGLANYDERIAAGWRAFFEALPGGSRILDLCTGNGAIAVIAAETGRAQGKRFAVTGVDLADIDPPRFVRRLGELAEAIDFRGNIDCASLPFAGATFDAAVSQYGLEYSDLARSLPNAVRVLAPGGRLRLGMHAAEGIVVSGSRAMIGDAQFLLNDVGLFDVAAGCIETIVGAERGAGPGAAERSRIEEQLAGLRQALARTQDYLPRAADQRMVHNSLSVVAHTFENRRYFDLPTLLGKIADLRAEVEAHRLRLVALVEAAVSEERVAQIGQELATLGLTGVTSGKQGSDDALLGHWIEAVRPRMGQT
jgi:SAM-dependent methyltransferase